MKVRRGLACLLLWCSMTAGAQAPQVQPRPADFDMQLPLAVSGDNGVVQLRLPLAVYQHSRAADLADVRVFNAAGEVVPFALLQPQISSERVSWREADARLFPIYSHSSALPVRSAPLEVRIATNGALVSVQSNDLVRKPDELTALILDLGPLRANERLDSLQFSPGNAANYRAALAIDRSDDLQLWDRVAQSRVDWLTSADAAQLVNDRVAMSGESGRYLRIQWLEGTPLAFSRVTARWRSSEAVSAEPLQVSLTPTLGEIAGDLLYAAGPSMAATQVGLDLPMPNTVVPASIGFYYEGRKPKDSQFIAIVNSTFYRLNHNGRERTSSRVQIAPQASAQWVVRAPNLGAAMPALVLRWHPSTLVFTARGVSGRGPHQFLLAVGAEPRQGAGWLGAQTAISLVAPDFSATELRDTEQAVAGQWTQPQVPTAAKRPVVRPNILENRGLMLWGVLLAGALLLAAMTWRLYRQMSKEAPR